MSLLSRLFIPVHRLFHIDWRYNTLFIKSCKIILSIPITMFSSSFCPEKRFFQIFFNTVAFQIEISNLAFC